MLSLGMGGGVFSDHAGWMDKLQAVLLSFHLQGEEGKMSLGAVKTSTFSKGRPFSNNKQLENCEI